jgi:ArsR family transcriptional regulator, arsenate/arsenite/antimonite-responsive transcriptional repressor
MKAKKSSAATLSDEQFHAIARALSDPRRMAIFQQIAAADGMSCSALQEHEVISPATVSHHMKELNEAGLVEMKRVGREAHLTLCRPAFQAYIHRLASLAKL